MLIACVAETLRNTWSSMRDGHLSDAERNIIGVKEYTRPDAEGCPVLSELIADLQKICQKRAGDELRYASNANLSAAGNAKVANRHDELDDDDNILTQE